VLLLFHAGAEPRKFRIPKVARSLGWWLFVNTAAEPPGDIYPELDGPAPPPGGLVPLEGRSLVCYVARDEP
jgi:glycogen operon protein